MAAPSLGNTQTTGPSSGGSVTITKPTSLAAGDGLLACISAMDGGSFTTPSGWTKVIDTGTDGFFRQAIFTKIADSADAAATNFTFTTGGSMTAGSLSRVINPPPTMIDQSGGSRNDSTSGFSTGGITPLGANSLMLMFVGWRDGNTTPGSVSGYAIATSNPTWTEVYDINAGNVGGNSGGLAMASASRPQTTATGSTTANISKSVSIGVIQIVDLFEAATSGAGLMMLVD